MFVGVREGDTVSSGCGATSSGGLVGGKDVADGVREGANGSSGCGATSSGGFVGGTAVAEGVLEGSGVWELPATGIGAGVSTPKMGKLHASTAARTTPTGINLLK